MNNLTTLRKLIYRLSNHEINQLLTKFESFSKTEENSKSMKLITVLNNKQEASSNDIQKLLYGKNNYSAFNKLCNRLKSTILEIITDDSSINKSNYSERNKQLFLLRKKMLQADILQLRGVNDDVLLMYNTIIAKSEVFEFYDLQLQALNSKLRFLSSFGKSKEIIRIKSEIGRAENNFTAYNDALLIYQSLLNKISLNSEHNIYINELRKVIVVLNSHFAVTQSSLIKYYLLNLEVENCQIEKRFNDANLLLTEMENLIKMSASVYTENRYGTVLLNIANNKLLLLDIDSAIEFAIRSKNYFIGKSTALKLVDEILFYANFYNNHLEKIDEYLKFDSRLVRNESNEFLFSKFNYYAACLEFRKGNFNQCIDLLNSFKEIDKDKEGWNVCKKILIILCRIENKELDSIDLSISNLNKYFKRISKTKFVLPRYKLILQICAQLINDNFESRNFQAKSSKYHRSLDKLKLHENKWQPKSPELIVFDDWISNKLKIKH